ncbi:MAG: TetR/AcrR family transcriptional regulator [Micromonosporaceae bacterium]
MRKRAEQVDETRQRIVDAAVHLHGTVGPAETTIAGIAEQAGVTRLTVYRHFPDDEALFAVCSAQWLSQQNLPDPDVWAQLADPEERLRAGLTDLYRFYREGQSMLTMVYRDLDALPAKLRQPVIDTDRRHRDVLLGGFGTGGATRRRLRAVLGHAVAFDTWRSLCVEHGLSQQDAVKAMVALTLTVASW